MARLRSLIDTLLRRSRFERGMAEELRFHVDAFTEDLVRSGVPRDEAARRARLEFGGVESVKERCRQARGLRTVDEIRQDVRYAIRTMARAPVLTLAAAASLALGIGANTAIFGFVDAVFLRTIPVPSPHELYYLGHFSGPETSSNYPLFERYRDARIFDALTAYWIRPLRVVTPEGAEPVTGQFVSGNYHAALGVPLAVGRGFISDHDRDASRPPVAVISDGYWARRFGRSPRAVGSTLNVGGRTIEIVGVTRPGFYGLDSESRVDITLPLSMIALDAPAFFDDHTGWMGMRIVGRLGPAGTEAQARTAAETVFSRYMGEPEQAWVRGPAFNERFRRAALLPASRGSDGMRERTATPLVVLGAMAGILLIVACANVANLLLARAAARRREVAVRVSMGASRSRLVRAFLTEGVLLATLGAVLGLPVALGISEGILSLMNAGPSPFALDVTVNGRVLAFTMLVAVLTGIGFALAPAIGATKVDPAPSLRASVAAPMAGHRALRGRFLLVSQIALCVLLLVLSGLLGRSLLKLRTFDAGFAREGVVLADVNTLGTEFTPESRLRLYTTLIDRLQRLPGVLEVSSSTRTPIDLSSQRRRLDVPGANVRGAQGVSLNIVSPGFFRTFGIRLLHGRGFTADDRGDKPVVAVVSEAMARVYFGSSNAIGRTFTFAGVGVTVVGVVEDMRHERLREPSASVMLFLPLAQTSLTQTSLARGENGIPVPAGITLAIRTSGNSRALTSAIRDNVRQLAPVAMVSYVRTIEQQLDASMVRERLLAVLSAGLSGLALLLACVGLYGTLSYNVARRAREIGIRMALGAARRNVLRQVLRESVIIAALGVIIGGTAALFATRLVSTFLFELSPRDPLTLASAAAVLLATALAAGYFPARKAAAVDPAGVLKAE